MSASANSKKVCVLCTKNAGILICDGCQQTFCTKHVIEHRQKLGVQLDCLMQEYDLLQNQVEQTSIEHSSLQKIDQWEKESIAKIQAAAAKARENIQKNLNSSREQFKITCHDLAEQLRSSREADDYIEHDLIHWTEQLKKLKSEITSSSSIKILEDNKAIIYLIKIETENQSTIAREPSTIKKKKDVSLPNPKCGETFVQGSGPAKIEDGGHVVRHIGNSQNNAYIRGNLLYYRGQHTLRFRLESCHLPYRIFLGCATSQVVLDENVFRHPSTVGWFGLNQIYQNGRCASDCKQYKYNSGLIYPHDILRITIDCDAKQIKLVNERLNVVSILKVNIQKTSFPWRLLMAVVHQGDCVRILNNK